MLHTRFSPIDLLNFAAVPVNTSWVLASLAYLEHAQSIGIISFRIGHCKTDYKGIILFIVFYIYNIFMYTCVYVSLSSCPIPVLHCYGARLCHHCTKNANFSPSEQESGVTVKRSEKSQDYIRFASNPYSDLFFASKRNMFGIPVLPLHTSHSPLNYGRVDANPEPDFPLKGASHF